MRILLTGASGFTGRNLAEKLAPRHRLLAPEHRELDLADQKAVDAYFNGHQIDAVVHTALKPMHRNARDLDDIVRTNLVIHYNLERNVRVRNIKTLYIGSGSCYGSNFYAPKMSEDYFGQNTPTSADGLVKYAISSNIQNSPCIYDLRVFGLFGKYEDYNIRFISNAICKALHGLPITLKQNRRFSYLYVDDLAGIVNLMLKATLRHRAYNLTPDASVTLLELAGMVRALAFEMTGMKVPIQVGQKGMGVEYTGDNSRFRREFPDVTFTDLKQAVRELIIWYSGNISSIARENLLLDL